MRQYQHNKLFLLQFLWNNNHQLIRNLSNSNFTISQSFHKRSDNSPQVRSKLILTTELNDKPYNIQGVYASLKVQVSNQLYHQFSELIHVRSELIKMLSLFKDCQNFLSSNRTSLKVEIGLEGGFYVQILPKLLVIYKSSNL